MTTKTTDQPLQDTEPRPPFPKQHQDSPGLESKLHPRPRYQAAQYRAANKLEHMDRGGVIIVTSSETGMMGSKKLPDYSARKGAINAFTKSLAQDVIGKGIRVNAVAPASNADSSYITGTVLQVMGGETTGG